MAAAKHTKAMRCETMHPFYKLCSSEDPAFWLPEFGKSAATARLADKSLPCFPCNQWRDRQSRHRVRPSDSEKLVCCESGQGDEPRREHGLDERAYAQHRVNLRDSLLAVRRDKPPRTSAFVTRGWQRANNTR